MPENRRRYPEQCGATADDPLRFLHRLWSIDPDPAGECRSDAADRPEFGQHGTDTAKYEFALTAELN